MLAPKMNFARVRHNLIDSTGGESQITKFGFWLKLLTVSAVLWAFRKGGVCNEQIAFLRCWFHPMEHNALWHSWINNTPSKAQRKHTSQGEPREQHPTYVFPPQGEPNGNYRVWSLQTSWLMRWRRMSYETITRGNLKALSRSMYWWLTSLKFPLA